MQIQGIDTDIDYASATLPISTFTRLQEDEDIIFREDDNGNIISCKELSCTLYFRRYGSELEDEFSSYSFLSDSYNNIKHIYNRVQKIKNVLNKDMQHDILIFNGFTNVCVVTPMAGFDLDLLHRLSREGILCTLIQPVLGAAFFCLYIGQMPNFNKLQQDVSYLSYYEDHVVKRKKDKYFSYEEVERDYKLLETDLY